MKKLLIFIITFCLIFSLSINCFAFSDSTYSDLYPTSSQVSNLINYAMSYSDFVNSDYVCYQVADYSYCIVWSDELVLSDSVVSAAEGVNYIISSCSDPQALIVDYNYQYGSSDSFSLNCNHMVVSNIDSLGFTSSLYSQYYFYDVCKNFLILGLAGVLFICLSSFRRQNNK